MAAASKKTAPAKKSSKPAHRFPALPAGPADGNAQEQIAALSKNRGISHAEATALLIKTGYGRLLALSTYARS